MMRIGMRVALFALLGSMVGIVAHAQRVTIDVKNVPLSDVLQQLHEQTGYELLVHGKARSGTGMVKVSLTDAPLKRALQEICRQVGREPHRLQFRYHCYVLNPARPGSEDVASTVAEDYVLGASCGEIAHRPRPHFGGPRSEELPKEEYPRLTIRVDIDAPDDAAGMRVLGIEPGVKLVDDRGRGMAQAADELPVTTTGTYNVVTLDANGEKLVGAVPHIFATPGANHPSQFYCRLDAPLPQPDAKALTMLGKLVVWQECRRVELSVPWGQVGAVRTANQVELTTQAFAEKAAEEEFEATFTVKRPAVKLPAGHWPLTRCWPDLFPWLVFGDGETTAEAFRGGGSVETKPANGHTVSEVTWEFDFVGRETARPTELVLETFVQAGPIVTIPFVIVDIPLPEERPKPVPSAPEPKDRGPCWAEPPEAGSLAFDVQIDDRPLTGPLATEVWARRRKDDGTYEAHERWYAIIDRNGHVVIGNVKPGRYRLSLDHGIGGAARYEVPQRLRDEFGADSETYLWVNDYVRVEVNPGKQTQLAPLRFVPRMTAVSPENGAVVPEEAVEFGWEAFPAAASYVVTLGVRPPSAEDHTFWVSDPVIETHLRYDPKAGHIQDEQDRQYLDLDPEMRYYWWVSALNAEGVTIARAHGRFQVK